MWHLRGRPFLLISSISKKNSKKNVSLLFRQTCLPDEINSKQKVMKHNYPITGYSTLILEIL